VREAANLAIEKARKAPHVPELRWSAFLGAPVKVKAKPAKKKAAKLSKKAGA
jgi:hypothetical protein